MNEDERAVLDAIEGQWLSWQHQLDGFRAGECEHPGQFENEMLRVLRNMDRPTLLRALGMVECESPRDWDEAWKVTE